MTQREFAFCFFPVIMVAYILPLADGRATLDVVGGKGASLARLARAGLPVPDGFHVTTDAYKQFIAANDLQPRLLAALAAVAVSQPTTLATAARAIYDLFARAPMPHNIADAIARAYLKLPGAAPAVAVRSSATAVAGAMAARPPRSSRPTSGSTTTR